MKPVLGIPSLCLVSAILPSILLAQEKDPHKIVVPNEFTCDDALSSVGDLPSNYRFQQVYAASQFSDLTEPASILAIAWRSDLLFEEPYEYTAERLLVRASVTDVAPAEVSPVFAENITGEEVTVHDGPIDISSESEITCNGKSRVFDSGFELQTPFEYDPKLGNLLVDFSLFGASSEVIPIDYVLLERDDTRQVYSLELLSDPEEGLVFPGHVIEFTFGTPKEDLLGDFNGNGALDDADIDLLSETVLAGGNPPAFDVNDDKTVDQQDREVWVHDLVGTAFGDADLDGLVNFPDFLALSINFNAEGGWAKGDFTGDSRVEFGDFLLLSQNFNAGTPEAVPEPKGLHVVFLAMAFVGAQRRRARPIRTKT